MDEDAPVADDGDDERQQHSDDDEEDSVVVGYGAVPQTLLSLGVEPVRRPAKVIRGVEGETEHPRRNNGDDGVTASEHGDIGVVLAHVHVAVDGNERDAEHGHRTADDTEAGCSRT